MPYMKGAGGIDTDEFQLNSGALPQIQISILLASTQDVFNLSGKPIAPQGEIDEAWGRYRDTLNLLGKLNQANEALSDG